MKQHLLVEISRMSSLKQIENLLFKLIFFQMLNN